MTTGTPVRPRCSVYIAISIDGFIARVDGNTDWLASVQRDGEDYGYAAFVADVDAFVIGRETYDTCLGFPRWPFEGKRVVVITHRTIESRHGEESFEGTATELVEKLGAEGVAHAYVDGGAVIRQFLAEGLVDSLTLSIVPIVLGAGRPLFGDGSERAFRLESARSWESGLAQLRYARL